MKTMKKKALYRALLGVMAGMVAQGAFAQAQPAPATGVDCTTTGCTDNGEILMRVRTRGERAPATAGATDSNAALQPDRRVTVEAEQPGRVVAVGKWSVQIPGGGVLWATEDPNLGQPQMDVSASALVPFDGQRVTKPVRFFSYSNYSDFIDRAEIRIFRASDTDLVTPLATVPLPSGAVVEAEWDGSLPEGFRARAGDELIYVVRAYGKDGSFDETNARRIQLVTPEEAERGTQQLRVSSERQFGQAMDAGTAEARQLIDGVFGMSNLRIQNIPIYGSKIRIQGRNL
ncbi:MAG: hypothetical protein IT479_12645, partial [Xanthomonadales bacterium]|nr:hypothetical protein [Xanthomonadales bacterium]